MCRYNREFVWQTGACAQTDRKIAFSAVCVFTIECIFSERPERIALLFVCLPLVLQRLVKRAFNGV